MLGGKEMSAIKKVTEVPTIDVNLVLIKVGNVIYGLDTANKIAVEVQTEDTDAVKLVIKNRLKAQKPESKTVTGNKITLTDNVFSPELALILQGGTIVYASVYEYSVADEMLPGKYYMEVDGMYLTITVEETISAGSKVIYNTGTGLTVAETNGVNKGLEAALDYEFDDGALKIEVTKSADETKIAGYRPPVAGSDDKGETFELLAYSAQYDAAGNILRYERITYPNCTGTPIALNSEDDTFRAPEYVINSAPSTGQAPYSIDYVPNLPKVQ